MQRYGNFDLVKELGRGATARIYLARHFETQAQVSLKIFHPQVFADAHFAQRIQRELKISAGLKHPNIVAVHELLPTDPPALVMDYIEGTNLENFQGRLPYVLPELSATIVIEILKALEYAHGQGLVHRDLKPENVLVQNDGKIFVTDFGLAKTLDTTMITQTNVILGSLDYMSPEQARGDSVTASSDLFSVAGILYFLTTGTRPFTRANTVTTLAAIRDESPEPPHHRNPKLSAAFSRILQKGMSKNPEGRFRSAREFRETLEKYLSDIGLGSFEFDHWAAHPTAVTLECLRTASEALIRRGEESLRTKHWDGLLESLAHLSLKAPQSGALSRLTAEYKSVQQRAKRRRWAYIIPIGLALVSALTSRWFYPRAPVTAAPAVVATPSAVGSASPVTSVPRPEVDVRQRPRGSVRFYVSLDTKVYWDGREIENPSALLGNQTLGDHKLTLVRAGFEPIRTKVRVTPGKPVVVNAK